jgi:hypothetical protein
MKMLQELLTLREAFEKIELKDLITHFPKFHGKALEKLWGGSRLVWNGDAFFTDSQWGPAYKKSVAACEAYAKDGYNTDATISLDTGGIGESHHGGDFTFDIEFKDADMQEVYCGYRTEDDTLFIGFDTWVSEDAFNEAWDKEFQNETGEEFDHENDQHREVFDKAWAEYQREGLGMWGVLYSITHGDDAYTAEATDAQPGGFYRGIYKKMKADQGNEIIDLRLD